MELKSLRCPNCNGPVRHINDNKYLCESCGTSFVADYDQEDVDIQRIKSEEEIRKKQLETAANFQNRVARRNDEAKKVAIIIVAVFAIFFMISIISTLIWSITRARHTVSKYFNASESYEAMRESMQEEAERLREEEEERLEEYKRKHTPKYVKTPEDFLSDETFVVNAQAALYDKATDTSFLVWTNNFIDGEPEVINSYLMVAKDETASPQNYLISIFKVNWYRQSDDGERSYFPLYECIVLEDLLINEDGTIKNSYSAGHMSWHSEIPFNQMFWGYSNYDDLYRECILANSDYTLYEIDFGGKVENNEEPEIDEEPETNE